ncbi:ATP-binding cassette domain-containing protein [Bradyrhizobium sp. sBnM-33]|uniref:ABC transporter ATP-binding protein n=1 Tax=Bradyrhizobium sp. sBnM-33 TaxID=2831780 RepID=UPI00289EF35B|nr:ATP-binding cassette domain-containing protein [Bradyrhizobium sp. sBnM-33]WOH53391.1 ATP-binding cassette domain-containing protein [Bradyrhizobium sp. sBnM-33]
MKVEIRDLGVSVGPVSILEGVSLDAPEGSVVGIVGHNGAGKTTLMRALTGALPVSSGRILFDGEDIVRHSTRQRVRAGLGYMPEDRRLVPDLSVRSNIALPMEVNGLPAAEIARRVARVLVLIPELQPLIDRKGNQLSGGQQKLAALARAISYGTRLLLLDEPFEGVAPALVARLGSVLRELRREGPTIIVTDSEGANLKGLCDAQFAIERGRVSDRLLET